MPDSLPTPSQLPPFIKGLKLSELYYHEAVAPVLSAHFPQLEYSAGRLDFGSDTLGYDTPQSRDHHWGPRLVLFLAEETLEDVREPLLRCLSENLPVQIHGYPTHFIELENDGGFMQAIPHGPVRPYISITSIERFLLGYTGLDITRALHAADWLAVPWQRLATIASGKVFHDGLQRLADWQALLRWYPHDLWLYTLAAQWRRIDQEEPFMARCGDVGDELGSRDVAARMIHHLMQLGFLMEKRWPPYAKWFGTAFARLDCAPALQPIFDRIHRAESWKDREKHLSAAYLTVGEMHNRMGLTPFIQPEISPFHRRPYLVPHAGRYAEALAAAIQPGEVSALPPFTGSIDQFVENVDVLKSIERCQRLKAIYQAPFVNRFPNPCPLFDPLAPDGRRRPSMKVVVITGSSRGWVWAWRSPSFRWAVRSPSAAVRPKAPLALPKPWPASMGATASLAAPAMCAIRARCRTCGMPAARSSARSISGSITPASPTRSKNSGTRPKRP